MILTYVVAVEAGSNSYTANIAISQSSEISFCFSNFTRPSTFFRFSAPRYLYRLMCTGEICTASERDRYDKSIFKAQRNAILCLAACFLYWCIYRVCKYYKEIQSIEEVEKRYKDQ